jgi:phenylpropionate dioxygenase-like ring-hydroxylating dioxygenase large terminal subunit
MNNLDAYFKQEYFGKERDNLFKKYWIYYCQASFLKNVGDTFSRDIAGVPVSVRKTANGLIAFQNICAHRKATIFFEEHVNRPFVCKYHGWVYDDTAKLSRIPNSQIYDFTAEKIGKCGSLKTYKVESVGDLIFVNLDENALDIGQQFYQEYLNDIAKASSHFDHEVVSTSWDCAYNWKLNFENVMDWNHVRFVHPSSFAPLQAKDPNYSETSQAWLQNTAGDKPFDKKDIRDLSYGNISDVNLSNRWFRKHIDRFGSRDSYYSWFTFPNVNFCSISGDHFLIQQFDPMSALKTRYRLEIQTAKRKDKVNFKPLLKALIDNEKKVIDEDIIYLESQQRNIESSGQGASYLQGANEVPLKQFIEWMKSNVYAK